MYNQLNTVDIQVPNLPTTLHADTLKHELEDSFSKYGSFEIVYKMKIVHSLLVSQSNADSITDEQMFFVPSLLSSFTEKTDHPAFLRWNSIETRYNSI